MNEKTLLKIALASSIVGIFLLLLILELSEVQSYQIANITNSQIDKTVKVTGKITKIKETPGLLILDIKDNTGVITAIAFKNKAVELEKNSIIEMTGKVQKYKDKLEIIANQINYVN